MKQAIKNNTPTLRQTLVGGSLSVITGLGGMSVGHTVGFDTGVKKATPVKVELMMGTVQVQDPVGTDEATVSAKTVLKVLQNGGLEQVSEIDVKTSVPKPVEAEDE